MALLALRLSENATTSNAPCAQPPQQAGAGRFLDGAADVACCPARSSRLRCGSRVVRFPLSGTYGLLGWCIAGSSCSKKIRAWSARGKVQQEARSSQSSRKVSVAPILPGCCRAGLVSARRRSHDRQKCLSLAAKMLPTELFGAELIASRSARAFMLIQATDRSIWIGHVHQADAVICRSGWRRAPRPFRLLPTAVDDRDLPAWTSLANRCYSNCD